MSFKKHDHRYDFEVHCPFNPQHQMPFKRLQYHLTQGCNDKRKYGHLYKMCPYNSLHFPHINNYDHHVHKCQKYSIRKDGGDADLLAEMRATLASQNKDVKQEQRQEQKQQFKKEDLIIQKQPEWADEVMQIYGSGDDEQNESQMRKQIRVTVTARVIEITLSEDQIDQGFLDNFEIEGEHKLTQKKIIDIKQRKQRKYRINQITKTIQEIIQYSIKQLPNSC
ncbi:hypothetical protein pb186bvf_001226 [Paramecium bursaria]